MAKITKAEMPALAEQIVKCLGGKENVARINHCATRLRVNPVDMEKVDKDGLKKLHGVIGIDASKAELQIIVGGGCHHRRPIPRSRKDHRQRRRRCGR